MSDEPAPETSAAPAGGAPDEAARPAPPPEEPVTGKHDLRKLAPRLTKQRRRGTRGEITFKRRGQRVSIPLDRSSTVIGRDARCDIVLDDEGVSRRHARVLKNEQGYFELVDMSSTNGTLVDGLPVPRLLLCDGDRFTVGETRFTVHLREEEG